MRGFQASVAVACYLGLTAFAAPARADQKVGGAAMIEKDVQGSTSGGLAKLAVGDDVYAGEVLTTGAASRGKFAFVDKTSMQMGPSSRVTLDNFVYSGSAGAGASVFNASKGAFRFVSGGAGHGDYQVKTPTATIGVRGTVFGVRATTGRTDAVIYDGAIEVCSTATGACRVIDKPCTFVTVDANGVTQPKKVGKNDWSFDKACHGAPPVPPGSAPITPAGGAPVVPDEPPAVPPFSFGGPSIGFTGGTAVGDTHFADPVPMNGAAFMGGLKFGYGFMPFQNIYTGFEADAQYRTGIAGGTNGIGGYASGSRDGYVGTVRAKIGYVFFDRFMLYGTGGFAYGHVVAPTSWSGVNVIGPGYGVGTSASNAFLPGVAYGGGVQVGLFAGVSVNVEYLYIHLNHSYPTFNTVTNAGAFPFGVCNISAMHGVRVGVNYGFNLGDLFAGGGFSSPLH